MINLSGLCEYAHCCALAQKGLLNGRLCLRHAYEHVKKQCNVGAVDYQPTEIFKVLIAYIEDMRTDLEHSITTAIDEHGH